MNIYAFDPGQTTGFVLLCTDPLAVDQASEVVTWDQWRSLERSLLETVEPFTIVVESFHLFPGAAQHLINNVFPAAQKIGVIEYIAAWVDHNVVFQAPSIKKMFPDKELVKVVGALPGSPHIKDALRHAVYYYFNNLWHKD